MSEQLIVDRSQLERALKLIERAEFMLPDSDLRVIDYRQEAINLRGLLKNDPVKSESLSIREQSVLDRLNKLVQYLSCDGNISGLCIVGTLDCLFNNSFPKKKESKLLNKDFYKLSKNQQLKILKLFINRNF